MRKIWLHPNRRIITLSMLLPCLLLVIGGVLLTAFRLEQLPSPFAWWCGVILVTGGGLLQLALLRTICLPRLAYDEPNLLVYLKSTAPVRLPIDVVECFFEGQAPSMVGELDATADTRAKAIVIRLAEAAQEWRKVDVNPVLGRWCDGYITIHGTWCEPLDRDLIVELNNQLVQSKRQLISPEEE